MSESITRRRWAHIRIIAFWGFAALIIAGSLMPAANIPETGLSDKAGHVIAYAILTVLGLYAHPRYTITVAGGVFVLGVALEGLQHLTPTRTFEWLDIVANGAGVVLGLVIAAVSRGFRG
ncbi:VanZ family protein [Thioalkalivibrio denitrificans]|uniref:VanZ family protein n=1 Tax=Thioalkalivibrio denitrificans TaxID=108003 RepID=A0A1V3NKQ5_9GAMM|nr:VanZ family protein [Thioalkalivibrio denitrificans]OOG25709.1 VanZ family protein [Thioalkalivibrio denitrificans]